MWAKEIRRSITIGSVLERSRILGNCSCFLTNMRHTGPRFSWTVFARYSASIRMPRSKVNEFENGMEGDPIAMRIIGDDLDTLKLLAGQVEQIMIGTTGTMSVNNPMRSPRTDLRMVIDRDKAGLLGLPLLDIQRTVRLGVAGLSVGQYRQEDGSEYDIVLGLPRDKRPTVELLDKMYVGSSASGYVPLRQIASMEFQTSPTKIDHYKQKRSVTVTSDVRMGYNTDKVTKQILAKAEASSQCRPAIR